MRLTEKEGVVQTATSVSPDGKWVVFNEGSPTGSTIWRVPLDSTSTPPTPELLFAADERSMNGNVSRDGKWLAFQSELSGRWEVYVQPFPGPGARKKVSTAGGSWPLWSKDERNLYFDSLDGRIMVADVSTAAGLSIGIPQTFFENRFKTSANSNTPFDVSLDGRFLGVQPVRPDAGVTQIQVVLNWATQLARR
jgi:serine/threonine-protein kinase